MVIRFYVSFTLFIFWAYTGIATVTQQHGVVKYFDDRYISEARAFTGRRTRHDAYLTNITVVTRMEFGNNVTAKLTVELKSVGTIVLHDMKVCEGFKISWISMIKSHYSNFTGCPIPAGRYHLFNMELPPKNFNQVMPKGEGTFHAYLYLTHSKKTIIHGVINVVSS